MGLAKFENSMFYLNHGKNFKDGAFSLEKLWPFLLKKSKCPLLAKKVADIYERVQIGCLVTGGS